MGKGDDMKNHVNEIKTISEHLEAICDSIAEHDLVIILISSLPEDFNYLITALETIAEITLTWVYVMADSFMQLTNYKSRIEMK